MTKYMLIKHYAEIEGVPPIFSWPKDAVNAHVQHMVDLSNELKGSGEWVGEQALTESATVVSSDGVAPPTITDGPFAESKEMLAGYMTIDVESDQRAFEVAARLSAAPGPGGKPIAERIEVRKVMEGNPFEDA